MKRRWKIGTVVYCRDKQLTEACGETCEYVVERFDAESGRLAIGI